MENKRFYANRFQMSMSIYDTYFKFITATPIYDEKNVIIGENISDSIEIFMSPQHTKALLQILTNHVKLYEEQFGEIKVNTLQGIQKDVQQE